MKWLLPCLAVTACAMKFGVNVTETANLTAWAASLPKWDGKPFNATANCNWGPLYKQCDPSWANNRLGTSSQTICQAGCAMSSTAMYLSARGHNENPATLNNWLVGHGGYVQGDELVWSSVNAFGISFQGQERVSESVAASGVAACHGLIANVRSGTHWVLLTGYQGNGIFDVHDPGFSQTTYAFNTIGPISVYH